MGTPIFLVKRASNSQDTVDYIVQRAARKNSSGFPGLNFSELFINVTYNQTISQQLVQVESLNFVNIQKVSVAGCNNNISGCT